MNLNAITNKFNKYDAFEKEKPRFMKWMVHKANRFA